MTVKDLKIGDIFKYGENIYTIIEIYKEAVSTKDQDGSLYTFANHIIEHFELIK